MQPACYALRGMTHVVARRLRRPVFELHDGAEINGSKHVAGSGAMSADEQREVARSIGLGGIKYAPGPVYRRDPSVTDEPRPLQMSVGRYE